MDGSGRPGVGVFREQVSQPLNPSEPQGAAQADPPSDIVASRKTRRVTISSFMRRIAYSLLDSSRQNGTYPQ
jgi:hypothetical protein